MKVHWLLKHVNEGVPEPAALLHHAEAARFAQLKSDKRRRDWLLGRQTAKQLLMEIWAPYTTRPLNGDELFIGSRESGEPFVVCDRPELADRPVSLSISHGHGYALSAVVEAPNVPLGIDLERVEPRLAGFADAYFTAEEQTQVELAGLGGRDRLITAIWSAKEAALKALHTGLSVDTRAVNCRIQTEANADGWHPLMITFDRQRFQVGPLPPLFGRWRQERDLVIAIVSGAIAQPNLPSEGQTAGSTPDKSYLLDQPPGRIAETVEVPPDRAY